MGKVILESLLRDETEFISRKSSIWKEVIHDKNSGSKDMNLVIEKYRDEHSAIQPPEPIVVPFKRYSRECVVSAIMEFLSYNFTMDSPPKYCDFEGDMILLETREAFEVAVDDVLRSQSKSFMVHIDGVCKFGVPKKQDFEQVSSSCNASTMSDPEVISMNRVVEDVKLEVNKQILNHPVIHKLAEIMNELEQKGYGASCSKQKSTQTNLFNASGSSSPTSKVVSKGDTTIFQLIDQSPVWDVKAIYERKRMMTLTKWENSSSSDLVKTVRDGEGIYSKRWVFHRVACKRWENVWIVNQTISDMLEIYRSKMIVSNLPGKGQVVDFTVWVKCAASTGYFYATWQLYKMSENGRNSIPEGPRLTLEIFLNPFTNESSTTEIPAHSNVSQELDSFSYCDAVRDGEQNIDDTQELEELASCGSVSASDYEVIDGGDTADDSETK